ncbi:nicotinate-nucleotide--dimethylbenzimidazole phosphoribosyltransferase [Flavihumibacter rivuli]|uniref:nicotinate-nucleotide--dimethylbenzimidazole phosphoribosyltransferase n=1 Tax=Flavihumibacter rivuli TaxID=2838156 RepID=UPI001BDEABBB|nr:nicotinate-nucleotide--dimethylbenzimidazole phosphoribosyltransferase [Flavihumibacter rivuli]ULQ56296.1 nicotinate-nucleotide--dimethylbenzimidazole phosphoribosyltransferase [Flavihumibacter rivuli]
MSTVATLLQEKINNKTKPLGSLGELERIALQAGIIQDSIHPVINRPTIVVFAGDHGISETGLVNPFPQSITGQMVYNFIRGGAAINVFCRQNGIDLKVVDAGVKGDFSDIISHPQFISAKINHGTRNYLEEAAMTFEETERAIGYGRSIVEHLVAEGSNCMGFGEMGIGNTSSASLLMAAITHTPLEKCVGKGTGADEKQLATKKATLEAVFEKHRNVISLQSPIKTLQYLGGYEIAMMVGAYLAAAEHKVIIVVDGFISTAALLVAHAMQPSVLNNCLFAHASGEQGHQRMLHYLNAKPLLNLGLRLGEGTGAALAMPLLYAAVNFVNEMASFEDAGVSRQ